jgi:hypothetical protein
MSDDDSSAACLFCSAYLVRLILAFKTQTKMASEAGLLIKSSWLDPTLGVTKFIFVKDLILVRLCCATWFWLRCSTNPPLVPLVVYKRLTRGGRKPTHLTSGNIRIRHPQKPSALYHEAKNTDVSRKNTDVSRVVFHPLVDQVLLCYLSVAANLPVKQVEWAGQPVL